MTEIYEKEGQKICKMRPTVQEMKELFKKLGISTVLQEMRRLQKIWNEKGTQVKREGKK
jgi:hypothetical protein